MSPHSGQTSYKGSDEVRCKRKRTGKEEEVTIKGKEIKRAKAFIFVADELI
jgi:hypothetical protein